MFSSKLSSTISKLEEEFRKAEIKKKYNLLVLSPTLGKARPNVKKTNKKCKNKKCKTNQNNVNILSPNES
jgi:hypothetical protein